MVISSTALPFADVKISLKTSIAADEKKTNNSEGITPNAGESVTLSVSNPSGVLGFKCAAEVKGTELLYVLEGTDKAYFNLGAGKATVTAEDKPKTQPTAKMALAMLDTSTAAKITMEGLCPGLGAAWIVLAHSDVTHTLLADAAAVKAAQKAYKPSTTASNYNVAQWCTKSVVKKETKTSCDFDSASGHKFNAAMYCETIEGWFYASPKLVAVTAKSNGGVPVKVTLTYPKAINDVTDNAIVLKLCGELAKSMAVPYPRVTDAYGGYFGNPSASLPKSAATTTTATTTTDATKTATTTDATKTATDTKTTTRVLATDATKMAETKSYKLTVKNVPTNQNSRWSAMQNL